VNRIDVHGTHVFGDVQDFLESTPGKIAGGAAGCAEGALTGAKVSRYFADPRVKAGGAVAGCLLGGSGAGEALRPLSEAP